MARRGGAGDETAGGGLCAFKAIGSPGRGGDAVATPVLGGEGLYDAWFLWR
jgi:hypothetical protein